MRAALGCSACAVVAGLLTLITRDFLGRSLPAPLTCSACYWPGTSRYRHDRRHFTGRDDSTTVISTVIGSSAGRPRRPAAAPPLTLWVGARQEETMPGK